MISYIMCVYSRFHSNNVVSIFQEKVPSPKSYIFCPSVGVNIDQRKQKEQESYIKYPYIRAKAYFTKIWFTVHARIVVVT